MTHRRRGTTLGSRTRGQASLEMTLAMLGAVVLFFGCIKFFIWVNHRMVVRQQEYEGTRVAAGRYTSGLVGWSQGGLKRLDFFGE